MDPFPKPFPSLAQVLEAGAAGWSDGVRTHIRLDEITNGMVFFHENIHERIFATTPDGFLLGLLLRVVYHPTDPAAVVPTALKEWAAACLDAARMAHEVAATYLGVKQLGPRDHPAAVASLPPQYQGYYRTFADVLDPLLHSSYLQYIVGWTLASCAFSSPLTQRFVAADSDALPQLEDGERPDARLYLLIHWFKQNDSAELLAFLDDAARRCCDGLGRSSWDLQSEDAWIQNTESATPVDMALTKALFDWIKRQNVVALLSGRARHDAYARLAEWGRRQGINVGVADTDDLGQEEALQKDRETRGYWLAGSLIHNAKAAPLPDEDGNGLLSDAHVILTSAQRLVVASAAPPDHMTACDLVVYTGGAPGEPPSRMVGRFPAEVVRQFLARRRDLKSHNIPVAPVASLTLAVRDRADWIALLPNWMACTIDGDGTGALYGDTADALCWYWHGNWQDALDTLTENSSLQLATLYPPSFPEFSRQFTQGHLEQRTPELCVKIVKVPDCPGIVLRAFPFVASSYLLLQEEDMEARGMLTKMPPETVQHYKPVIESALTSILSGWSQF